MDGKTIRAIYNVAFALVVVGVGVTLLVVQLTYNGHNINIKGNNNKVEINEAPKSQMQSPLPTPEAASSPTAMSQTDQADESAQNNNADETGIQQDGSNDVEQLPNPSEEVAEIPSGQSSNGSTASIYRTQPQTSYQTLSYTDQTQQPQHVNGNVRAQTETQPYYMQQQSIWSSQSAVIVPSTTSAQSWAVQSSSDSNRTLNQLSTDSRIVRVYGSSITAPVSSPTQIIFNQPGRDENSKRKNGSVVKRVIVPAAIVGAAFAGYYIGRGKR